MDTASDQVDIEEHLADASFTDDSTETLILKAKLEAQANDSELNWLNTWLRYLIDRFRHGTDLIDKSNHRADRPRLENRFVERYSLPNSRSRSLLAGDRQLLRCIETIQAKSMRLAKVGKTEEVLQTIRKCMNAVIDELVKDIPPLSSRPDDVAFRQFCINTDPSPPDFYPTAHYFGSGEIRCAGWQDFHPNHPLKWGIAKSHVRGHEIERGSPLISISTSPKRIGNRYYDFGWEKVKTCRTAVIDLQVLAHLGISYGSTTLHLQMPSEGKGKVEYANDQHHLVHGWIPSRAILGLLDVYPFDALMQEAGILIGPIRNKNQTWYDMKIDLEAIRRKLLENGASEWYRRQEQVPLAMVSPDPGVSLPALQL